LFQVFVRISQIDVVSSIKVFLLAIIYYIAAMEHFKEERRERREQKVLNVLLKWKKKQIAVVGGNAHTFSEKSGTKIN